MSQLRALPHPDALGLTCPKCHAHTELRGGPAYGTPLGIRRYRRCERCTGSYQTLESPTAWQHEAVLAVPVATPAWVLRWLERLARWAARVGR